MLVWTQDEHCRCPIRELFLDLPVDFLVEEEIHIAQLSPERFQLVNYMVGEADSMKDAPVRVDPERHVL